MAINKRLFPIKAHYFFFMSAMGPILPQLPVYGKELGISTVVMGTVTAILPLAFLIAKPLFGMLVDVYRDYRKSIFMLLIVIMILSYTMMGFIPTKSVLEVHFGLTDAVELDTCKVIDFTNEAKCNNVTTRVTCNSTCFRNASVFLLSSTNSTSSQSYRLCAVENSTLRHRLNYTNYTEDLCDIYCEEDLETDTGCLYKTSTFWSFVILMSIGSIGFNVVNSISDAICFDVIGDEFDYGKQRVWGTIGFGTTALIAGYAVDLFSGKTISYIPAMVIMLCASVCDLIACVNLKLPIIESPKNILKDLKELFNNRYVVTFMGFAVLAGILDGFIIYYLFWYLEDLAEKTQTSNIKLLEGLIVAAETLGGEVIFFSVADQILKRFGHVHCFSMCFVNYGLRLGLISMVPSPWYILPIEFVFQGPTYALTYTTIVAYANDLAPPGASATMQGIAAGMDDGVGYSIGSILGGLLYHHFGGRNAFHCFSILAVICSISHAIIHKTILKDGEDVDGSSVDCKYDSPEEASKIVCSS